MTDLESPKKNNDCYFYYYSTCVKGDSCGFRHEPSALGCETVCSFWKEGKCLNIHCNFRHMELRKNRKIIPCYWETQPHGCLKAHCPFLHQNPRASDHGTRGEAKILSEKSSSNNLRERNVTTQNERKVTAVDSLVVNFEEESDNESTIVSPMKRKNRVVSVKTLEEIKLEKIQAESAAYYSYGAFNSDLSMDTNEGDLRQRIARRVSTKTLSPERRIFHPSLQNIQGNKRLSEEELADILGDESLRKKQKIVVENEDGNLKILLSKKITDNQVSVTITPFSNKRTVKETSLGREVPMGDIKIKTLAEIRAEKNSSMLSDRLKESDKEEAEVSSTSIDESTINQEPNRNPKKKIRLIRKVMNTKNMVECCSKQENEIGKPPFQRKIVRDKIDEEELLLDGDEDCDVSLKAEEDLLNEIDNLLDD